MLTGVNIYYFFLRQDTSVQSLMRPMSTSRALTDGKKSALNESIPPSLLGAAYKEKKSEKPAQPAAKHIGFDDGTLEGKFGPSEALITVLQREGFGSAMMPVVTELTKLIDPK